MTPCGQQSQQCSSRGLWLLPSLVIPPFLTTGKWLGVCLQIHQIKNKLTHERELISTWTLTFWKFTKFVWRKQEKWYLHELWLFVKFTKFVWRKHQKKQEIIMIVQQINLIQQSSTCSKFYPGRSLVCLFFFFPLSLLSDIQCFLYLLDTVEITKARKQNNLPCVTSNVDDLLSLLYVCFP